MSSLWTPEGEHRVGRQTEPPSREEPPAEQLSAEEEARLRQVTTEILSTPVQDVVANHCYGLFELAALHLSQHPPNLEAARTAIDSMGYLVDGLGDRLGQHAPTLADGLNQLRLAFVAISQTPSGAEAPGEEAAPPPQ